MAESEDVDIIPLKRKKTSRLGKPITSDELTELSKGVVPSNTRKNDAWALNIFTEWLQ